MPNNFTSTNVVFAAIWVDILSIKLLVGLLTTLNDKSLIQKTENLVFNSTKTFSY